MRQRISWDKEKVAEIMKQADPYTMNQDRKNPPAEKYRTGDPSAWGEDQNKDKPWESEGRDETGHPAPEKDEARRAAVKQARLLEDKALKCLTIASRMLPGADASIIEEQALDLMFLPERSVMATTQRQSELASKIAAEVEPEDKDEEKKEEVEEKDAAKKDKEEIEEKDAAKKDKKDEEEVEASKKDKEKDEEVEAKKEEKKDEEEVEASKKKDEEEVEAKKDEEKLEEKEASKDLLDILFDSAEVSAAQEVASPKTGAKKLSGLVKQASTGNDPLAGLWGDTPDISSVFGK
jgi:hypothetical protein